MYISFSSSAKTDLVPPLPVTHSSDAPGSSIPALQQVGKCAILKIFLVTFPRLIFKNGGEKLKAQSNVLFKISLLLSTHTMLTEILQEI